MKFLALWTFGLFLRMGIALPTAIGVRILTHNPALGFAVGIMIIVALGIAGPHIARYMTPFEGEQ